jgi:hypothetical protein
MATSPGLVPPIQVASTPSSRRRNGLPASAGSAAATTAAARTRPAAGRVAQRRREPARRPRELAPEPPVQRGSPSRREDFSILEGAQRPARRQCATRRAKAGRPAGAGCGRREGRAAAAAAPAGGCSGFKHPAGPTRQALRREAGRRRRDRDRRIAGFRREMQSGNCDDAGISWSDASRIFQRDAANSRDLRGLLRRIVLSANCALPYPASCHWQKARRAVAAKRQARASPRLADEDLSSEGAMGQLDPAEWTRQGE